MNIHKNARLTFVRRLEMVLDVIECKLTLAATAAAHGVSVPTVRKWVGRYLTQGEPGLRDASSRPQVSPRALAPRLALAIVELRRRFLTQARIAQTLGVSESTVSRILARAGLSRWSDLAPSEPTVRYEHAHPGSCCISTPRNSAALCAWGIGSPAIRATASTVPVGSSCSSPSMTMRASALPR
jgi:transposase-like protein